MQACHCSRRQGSSHESLDRESTPPSPRGSDRIARSRTRNGAAVYNWWVFIHVVGVIGFVLAHGVSTAMALRVPRERDPERLRALLELSGSTAVVLYASTFVLLLGGFGAGFDGHWFSQQAWISVALGVFVAEMVFMWAYTRPYYRRLRRAMAIEQAGGTAVGPREIEQLVESRVPTLSFWVGAVGLLFIVYLMIIQPF